MILYIPFEKHKSGDLSYGGQLWQEQMRALGKSVQIIYYQDEISDDDINQFETIYVIAHGFNEGNDTTLLNHQTDPSQRITPEELSHRFTSDFTYFRWQISDIHLYCCGISEKNRLIANSFRSHLLSTELANVHFYSGTLQVPNEKGQLTSYTSETYIPVEIMRKTFHAERMSFANQSNRLKRTPIKNLFWHEIEQRRKNRLR